jgi:hypothetical protein
LADATALGAVGETLGGSIPLPPISSEFPLEFSGISAIVGFFLKGTFRYLFRQMRFRFAAGAHLAHYAGVAQLVERNLAKVDVTGSNPASRSRFFYAGVLRDLKPHARRANSEGKTPASARAAGPERGLRPSGGKSRLPLQIFLCRSSAGFEAACAPSE